MFDAVNSLRVMFQSMNSPSQLNWNGDDPCGQSWQGITCSGNRVTEMWSHNLPFTLYDLVIIAFGVVASDSLFRYFSLLISKLPGRSLSGSLGYQLESLSSVTNL